MIRVILVVISALLMSGCAGQGKPGELTATEVSNEKQTAGKVVGLSQYLADRTDTFRNCGKKNKGEKVYVHDGDIDTSVQYSTHTGLNAGVNSSTAKTSGCPTDVAP